MWKLSHFLLVCKGIFILHEILSIPDSPGSSDSKESACSAGDLGSIRGLGRSSGEGNGTPLQYSCLENPMDRGAWRAEVHGVSKSWTWLTDLTHTLSIQLWFWVVSLQCFNCYGFIIMCFNMIQYCCCAVSQLWQTLLDPMNCSTPGFPVLHHLQEFAQTSCPLSQWCHPAISSSATLFSFSSCPQFPALGSLPMSQLFASGGESIEASASSSVFPMNSQGWFPLGFPFGWYTYPHFSFKNTFGWSSVLCF